MKKKIILSEWENKTYDVLDSVLSDTGYRVHSVLSLKDVLKPEEGDVLGKKLREHFETSHLDFVVVNEQREPEFAIEFDGMHHNTKPRQREADIRKNKLCNLVPLPLWRIDSTELTEHDTCSILAFMIMRFVAWRRERTSIEQEIAEYVTVLDDKQRSALVEDGVLDASIDPSFHFDIRHPFPGTREVVERLLKRHNVVGLQAHPLVKSMSSDLTWQIFYDTLEACEFTDGHDRVVQSKYVVSRADKPSHEIMTICSDKDRLALTVLRRGSMEFRIKSTLPIVHDYDPNESVFEYLMRKSKIPVWVVALPGITPSQVARHMSEYFTLLEVEEWIESNGPL